MRQLLLYNVYNGIHLLSAMQGVFSSPVMIALAVCAAAALAVLLGAVAVHLFAYRLTLHLGEGQTVYERHPGDRAIEVQAPAPRKGLRFAGWFLDEARQEPVPRTFRVPRRGAHLYAKWLPLAETAAQEHTKQESMPDIVYRIPENSVHPEEEDEADDAEVIVPAEGEHVYVQYRRSFQARLILADDAVKQMYNGIRCALLSYIGVKERISWSCDTFLAGKRPVAKVTANTKSLIVHFALDPAAEALQGYAFRDDSEKRRYAAVPVRCKISDARSYKNAAALLRLAAERAELDYSRVDAYTAIPAESRDALIEQGLIKVYARSAGDARVSAAQLKEMIASGAHVRSIAAYFMQERLAKGPDSAAAAGMRSLKAKGGQMLPKNIDTNG